MNIEGIWDKQVGWLGSALEAEGIKKTVSVLLSFYPIFFPTFFPFLYIVSEYKNTPTLEAVHVCPFTYYLNFMFMYLSSHLFDNESLPGHFLLKAKASLNSLPELVILLSFFLDCLN